MIFIIRALSHVRKKRRKAKKRERSNKKRRKAQKMREKERRDSATILFSTLVLQSSTMIFYDRESLVLSLSYTSGNFLL